MHVVHPACLAAYSVASVWVATPAVVGFTGVDDPLPVKFLRRELPTRSEVRDHKLRSATTKRDPLPRSEVRNHEERSAKTKREHEVISRRAAQPHGVEVYARLFFQEMGAFENDT